MFNLVKGRSYDASKCCEKIPQWRVLFNQNHTVKEFIDWILTENKAQKGGISIVLKHFGRRYYMRFYYGSINGGKLFPENIMNTLIKEITASGSKNCFMDYNITLRGDSIYNLWTKENIDDYIYGLIQNLGKKSIYDFWLSLGNRGTEEDFINSFKSKSAYQMWLDSGHKGTEEDFLNSLKGKDGKDAKSVYEIYLDGGGTLSEEDFLKSILIPSQWGEI